MPISPANMLLYPGGSIRSPEWLAIRERIRKRAGNKCEECGVDNHDLGYRDDEGVFHGGYRHGSAVNIPLPGAIGYRRFNLIRIVCTVAHFDGELTDHSDENLRFWCQRCHNRHDAKQRQENATITRHNRETGRPD